MKNLTNSISVVVMALVMMVSFNVNAQKELSKKDQEYVKSEFRKGMASFVESVTPFYKKGMTLNQFKTELVGKNTKGITKEGNALLDKAFEYLTNSTSRTSIERSDSGKEIAAALVYVKRYNVEKRSSSGDVMLFGADSDSSFAKSTNAKRKCKWYQVGCHLSNVWDWLGEDDNGDGETNAEEIIQILTFVFSLL